MSNKDVPIAITHSPGKMLVTDWLNTELRVKKEGQLKSGPSIQYSLTGTQIIDLPKSSPETVFTNVDQQTIRGIKYVITTDSSS